MGRWEELARLQHPHEEDVEWRAKRAQVGEPVLVSPLEQVLLGEELLAVFIIELALAILIATLQQQRQ